MTHGSDNVTRALAVVRAASKQGVRTWCVAPGARNAPLVAVLERTERIELISHYDERAAGFFALGRARRDLAPVAVTTTSGTAAAELLPSAIEAHYSGVPVLFVTADRPQRMRGTGAPQAIEQQDLLAPYAPMLLDSDAGEAVKTPGVNTTGPTHWNVAFDEPLLVDPAHEVEPTGGVEPSFGAHASRPGDQEGPPPELTEGAAPSGEHDVGPGSSTDNAALDQFISVLKAARRPLVLVGPLDEADVEAVCSFLLQLNAPVHADATSGLRSDPRIEALRLRGGDRSLAEVAAKSDAVIRLGDIPTARLWRDVGATSWSTPIASLSRRPFAGRPGGPHAAVPALATTLPSLMPPRAEWSLGKVRDRDLGWARATDDLVKTYPRSEPAIVRAFSHLTSGLVYLGNSLPVREWDAFATLGAHPTRIAASRGANGIDGQLSTFFGLCRPDEDCWALLGDLTTLYDLGAPWVLDRIETGPLRIAVINNGGGRIFDRVFPDHSAGGAFRNAHALSFEAWASMWSIPYTLLTAVPDTLSLPNRAVLELRPDEESTLAFWREYAEIEV